MKTLNSEIKPIQIDVSKNDRRSTSTSSKGNQTKWFKDGKWIKVDYMGYEGLSEVLATYIAEHTNIVDFAPITKYYLCTGIAEGRNYVGCYSNNFLADGEECVTVQRLLAFKKGRYINKQLEEMSTQTRIKTVVDFVIEETSISNFGEWLTALLEFDGLILNEDRHLHNVAVIRITDGTYKLMPLFDNGAAFLSDVLRDFPMSKSVNQCIRSVKAKPFSTSFSRQVKAAQELYGSQLSLRLSGEDITDGFLDGISEYSQEIKQRVLVVLRRQIGDWHGKTTNDIN